MRRPGTPHAAPRALLVGDAAGLIDPVSGDGMYERFVSATLAATATTNLLAGRASPLEAYAGALDAALAPLHRASWKLERAFDRRPRTSWRIARTELLWRSVERLLLGEPAAPGEQQGVARVPLRLLDALARVGSYPRSHCVDLRITAGAAAGRLGRLCPGASRRYDGLKICLLVPILGHGVNHIHLVVRGRVRLRVHAPRSRLSSSSFRVRPVVLGGSRLRLDATRRESEAESCSGAPGEQQGVASVPLQLLDALARVGS